MNGPSRPGVFADLADGGRALAEVLAAGAAVEADAAVVLAVVPNGVPAAIAAAAALGCPLAGVEPQRDDAGVHVPALDLPGATTVVVVDDAVETGTAALAVGRAVRAAAGPATRVVLAVPVCPREAEARMLGVYDAVVAAVRPLARRSLRWHYPTFSPVPVDQAWAAVSAYEEARAAG